MRYLSRKKEEGEEGEEGEEEGEEEERKNASLSSSSSLLFLFILLLTLFLPRANTAPFFIHTIIYMFHFSFTIVSSLPLNHCKDHSGRVSVEIISDLSPIVSPFVCRPTIHNATRAR